MSIQNLSYFHVAFRISLLKKKKTGALIKIQFNVYQNSGKIVIIAIKSYNP